ncbi:hypothetical protein [Actinophytocola oryzae]|uniref:Uncharacterized protein n=1 Tax=Actinophytocola oryzae TaxID=502181 RepID=A0A4R7UPG0_9PSEU|nr:hypothetical protein [Actinophytocola oryzae]TDV35442.1 hypothetical protein CLV71_13429 [Actinophytocola oryzae]
MAVLEETWEWVYPSLRDLEADVVENPDRTWEERRAYLVERLGLTDPADHPVAEALVRWLDELPDDDRAVLIGGEDLERQAYEVIRVFVDAASEVAGDEPADESYDQAAWQSFLLEYGPHWDGTAQTWEQFRDWFDYHGRERGLGVPTNGLLAYLAAQSPEERVATFAQYGVVIAVAQNAAENSPQLPSVAEVEDAHMSDLLAEEPAFAQIPEDRRRELIAEALGELTQR